MSIFLNSIFKKLNINKLKKFSKKLVPPKENLIMNSDGQVLDKFAGPIEENDDLSLVCEAFGKIR